MTATRTLYRKANVSAAEATTSIFKRFPNVELVSFVKKEANAQEAKAARAKEGELVYEATIRVAEFPPEGGDDKADEGGDAPEPKKEEAPKEESDSDPDNDGDDDSSPEGDTDHDFAGGPEHGAEPKKLSPEEQVVHLLQQILDALKGGGPKPPHGGPDLGGPDMGADLPDIGAPGKDEMGGGLGGPGGPPGKAPLPPPVKEKAPIGAGAFAHVTGRSEVTMVRDDAGEVGNKSIIAEAATYAPQHRVAKIQRTGIAQIGDDLIDLAEANKALVTLVSR